MSKIDLSVGALASLALGGIAAIALSLVWGGFWMGLTLSTLWEWFIVPVFGLPVLGILQAYGVALVARAMRGYEHKERDGKGFGAAMAQAFFLPPVLAGLLLVVGWVAKAWM